LSAAQYYRRDLPPLAQEVWGLDVFDARKPKVLESENAEIKRLIAKELLVIEGSEGFARKK